VATGLLGFVACAFASSCTYDPPPEVSLAPPANKHFVVGEAMRLVFSEPVLPESLEVRVWPGQKDLYTVEKELKPGVKAIMDTCTLASSPCAGGKAPLTLSSDKTEATLLPAADAFGPLGTPLVLEVSGSLADPAGNTKVASRVFDFQIVAEVWDPFAEVHEQPDSSFDVELGEPLGIPEGRYLFLADFTSPIPLSQQFWTDVKANQLTGEFVLLLTDADPIEGAPQNTGDPKQLKMDTGGEGFIFVMHGQIHKDEDQRLIFKAEPVTLALTIGSIKFELRDMVCAGSIDQSGELPVWNGTLAVKEIYLEIAGSGTIYPEDQANFQIVGLADEDVPEGMPSVCMEDPCSVVGGKCDLLEDWPPEGVCAAKP